MNGSPDYKIGMLEQSVIDIATDVKEIKEKVEALNVWRWKVIGATGIISIGLSLVINYFM